MLRLDGTRNKIELAPGYEIAAPGLEADVKISTGKIKAIKGLSPEAIIGDFDKAMAKALRRTGISIDSTIEFTPTKALRGQVEEPLILDVPDRGKEYGQLVMSIDGTGMVTWNLPVKLVDQPRKSSTRSAAKNRQFHIRRYVPLPSEAGKKGLIGIAGRQILSVLLFPIADKILGKITGRVAHMLETKRRPYQIRRFGPDNFNKASLTGLSPDDWRRLGEGRSLLFIHGTNSNAHTGFANFDPATLEELYRQYDKRVFAFNHLTLSEDPRQNAEWFTGQIPPGLPLDMDIICHSRGGLVARALVSNLSLSGDPMRHVNRIVFVGAPNNGTILANRDNLNAFVDRYTTLLNLAPPGPAAVVAEILENVIWVVKLIGLSCMKGLRGLSVLDPESQFLRELDTDPQMDTRYYAIASDYEPKERGLINVAKKWVADQCVDRIFNDEPNDLLVPTVGVYEGSKAFGFPIPSSQVLKFGSGDGVGHSQYFTQPKTNRKLKDWLLTGR